MALLPASGNFFRLIPHEDVTKQLDQDSLEQLDKDLSKLEKGINTLIDTQALRVSLFEALKLLIITGNVMLYKVKGGGMKVFNPYEYAVSRDYVGNVVEICIKEVLSKKVLPTAVRDIVSKCQEDDNEAKEQEDVAIYTNIIRVKENKYVVYQEVTDTIIPGSMVTYTQDALPYLPLRS